MKRNLIYSVIAILVCSVVLMTSCAPAGGGANKVATFIYIEEYDTLNPYYTNMWFSAIDNQIWNCWAWDFDDQNNPIPRLVTEIPSEENGGVSPDGSVITLSLRSDLVWSDGEPLDADDFLFTYDMVMNTNNSVSSTYPFSEVASIEAPDPQTVVMTFQYPFAPWLATLWQGILPEHILAPVFEAEGTIDQAEWNTAPTVGCGPFTFVEWESGSFARYVTNENYWGEKPNLDEIYVRFVPDDASQIAALISGDGDLGTFIAYPDIPQLEDAGVEIYWSFSGYNEGLYFNLDPELGHPALQELNVRKAIAYALDRFALCEDLLLDRTEPPATYWANSPFEDPALEPWPYDPVEAERLLDEAGWIDTNDNGTRDKDGVELILRWGVADRDVRKDTQAIAQQELADVGIGLELLVYSYDIYFEGYAEGGPMAKGEIDIYAFSTVTNFPDPDTAEWYCSEIPTDDYPVGINYQRVCDPTLDDLFQQEISQVDFDERQQTFYEISRYIFENVYWLGLWWDPDSFAINARLQNVKISGATPYYNIAEWDIAP